MRIIIAPTDFSSISLNAVKYAADLAATINAELLLLNVVQIPMVVAEIPLTEFEYGEMTDEAEQELSVLSHQLILRTKNKIRIRSKMVMGSVEYELKEICEVRKPFAVIMGTKDTTAAAGFFLGSNTLFAINNLKYPVLVVPQNVSFSGIKKIALASDLKELESVRPIEYLREWLKILGSKLDIINVIEHASLNAETVPGSISLQNLLSEFNPHFHFIEKENVAEGVNQFIKENHPDILAIIPKEHGLLSGLFHKSRSKPFILHPHIPVLAIAE